MKIAHVLWALGTGGIETMVVDIANCQSEDNDVSLIVVNSLIYEPILRKISPKVSIKLLGRPEGNKNPWYFLKLNVCLWKLNPDIVHVHNPDIRRMLLIRKPIVRTIHNTNIFREKERGIYDAVYAISDSVSKEWNALGEKNTVVMNGIVVSNIRNKRTGVYCDGKIHFVQVSRLLISQKGQDLLIKAAAIAKQKLGAEKFMVHLVGEGPDEGFLKQLVADERLDDVIVFEGLKDRRWIYDNLCEFDCFVQASRFEGFGLTVAEACAAKIPVLVSDNEGPLEIIDGGRLGLTFKNKDVDDLASHILMFLDGEYDYKLLELAYQRTIDLYDVKRTAGQYIKEYKKLLP